ncbi:M15 family metallopeptidase [Yinghuangia sp. YIM S10712]|uniref:M15 family metallopeptidase n=1 Tax=Yinghuangia sp. YIM S10712 TaxID=3436930 RepID=UPI003F531938
MTRTPPSARTPTRPFRRLLVVGLIIGFLVGIAVIAVALGHTGLESSSSTSSSSSLPSSSSPLVSSPPDTPRTERPGEPGEPDEADGVVPDGVTVFDDVVPGVAKLDPALLGALRQAATDAADDGVEFHVNSGWRSPEYQEQLLREAIAEYGSEREAARWVATPEKSLHVAGDAVDIGPSDATAWLSEHGDKYGVCQIYKNEPWHYELRTEAINRGCPRMYADPTQDPRLQ